MTIGFFRRGVSNLKRRYSVTLLVAATAATVAWGCMTLPENVGMTTEALEAGAVGSNNGQNSSEVWAAWSPPVGPVGETLVINYNIDNYTAGWAWSPDQGSTWNTDTSNSIDAGAPVTDSGVTAKFRGDPVLVADHRGNVVLVNMFQSAANFEASQQEGGADNVDQVIAVVSRDGGRTFLSDHVAIVNDGHCSDGTQDQPAAAFDYTTEPPTLWVIYRHAGGGNSGACVRRGFLNPANLNRITWLDDSLDLQNFFGEGGTGIGSVRIQAGDGAVTVVYTNTEATPENCWAQLPPTSLNSFATEALTSFDNGHSWQTKSRLFHSDSWAACVLSSKVQIGGPLRNFDFVRSPDGTSYVIAQYDQWRARLFKSRLQGAGSSGNTDAAWSEGCPNTATDDAGTNHSAWTPVGVACPEANWTFVRVDPPGKACSDLPSPPLGVERSCALAFPNIAADDQNRLVISYYESDDTNQWFHVKVWSNPTPRTATSTWQSLSVNLPSPPVTLFGDAGVDFDPFPADAGGGSRNLGDYESMTVRFGSGAPACGVQGAFFPVWTVVNAAGGAAGTTFEQTVGITP